MPHLVLLGDSVFDNARYVPDRPAVIEQVRESLPADWRATLLAVDGHVVEDVAKQLRGLPPDATHLFISAGGNDALGESTILHESVVSVGEALSLLAEVQDRFRGEYQEMLRAVRATGLPAAVCTVYDSIPMLGVEEKTAMALFNEVILREAFVGGLPVLDLRLVCTNPADYSHVSPIEPSMIGGAKIARLIADVAQQHDFSRPRAVVYPGP
jgi:hypothetical protein